MAFAQLSLEVCNNLFFFSTPLFSPTHAKSSSSRMGKRRGLHSRYYHTVLSIFDGVVERAPARGIALLAQLHAVATSRLHNIILNPPLRLRSVTFHRIANDGTTPKDTQASRHTAMETSNDPPHSMPLPSLSANAQGDSTSNHRDESRSETNVETSRPSYSSDAGYRSNGQIACRPAQSSISNNMDLFANLQQQPQSDVEQSWQSESRQMTRDEIMLDL